MKTASWHVTLETALIIAASDADKYGLPQTVFSTSETCGWANTNPFSCILDKAQIFATMLPARYFS